MKRLYVAAALVLLGAVGLACAAPVAHAGESALANERSDERNSLIRGLQRRMRARDMSDVPAASLDRTLAAMREVARHRFVPESYRGQAYANRPLPIGHGQTISQPQIVALMTAMLVPDDDDTALEVGTGSGYQAAVLAKLVSRVYTIEIIPELGQQATRRLQRLGYDNVETQVGDGYYGWPEHGPFDIIVVTAAASHIPPPLVRQLKPGGRMVIPVGGSFSVQQLMLVRKSAEGNVRSKQKLPVRFVPLTGGH